VTVAGAVLATFASIATFTGYTLKDLVAYLRGDGIQATDALPGSALYPESS